MRGKERIETVFSDVYNICGYDINLSEDKRAPREPGLYRYTGTLSDVGGGCDGDGGGGRSDIWVKIPEPSIASVTGEFKPQSKDKYPVSYKDGVYYIPYSRHDNFIFHTSVNSHSEDYHQLDHCDFKCDDGSQCKGKIADINKLIDGPVDGNKSGSFTLHPQYIKPGQTIKIQSRCYLKSNTGYSGLREAQNSPVIFSLHRNEANLGAPYFTLQPTPIKNTTSPGHDRATDQHVNWEDNINYAIGVAQEKNALISPETCTINSNKYNYKEGELLTVKSHLIKSEHADKGDRDYEHYGETVKYSGSCEVGQSEQSPYHAYPVTVDTIKNAFSITRKSPRITKKGDFKGSQFGNFSPDGDKTKLRPGEKVTIDATAQLTGDFPHAVVQIVPKDSNLTNETCPNGWTKKDLQCVINVSDGTGQTKPWILQANNDLMERTTGAVTMTGSNYELDINSEIHSLDTKKVTITPVMTLEGKLEAAKDTLKNKVFHYGRQFTLAADYTLTGYTPDPRPNTAYKGKLTTLNVTPEAKMLAAGKASQPTLIVAGQTVAVNRQWNGRATLNLMGVANVALDHDQKVEFQVPLTVTRSTYDPKLTPVKVQAWGAYAPTNVDLKEGSKLMPSDLAIMLGPDLYPARNVYHMDVNPDQPLHVVSGSKQTLSLRVNFDSRLKKEQLVTPEGVRDTAMTITLPDGLKRDTDQSMSLYCGSVDCSSKLKNDWDGKKHLNILAPHFLLEPNVEYTLSVPLVASREKFPDQPNVAVTMWQAQTVDQDTKERIVIWDGADSATTVNKPIEIKQRGDIAVNPLNYKDQSIDNDNVNVAVDIKNAQPTDQVTLTGGGISYPMKAKNPRAAGPDSIVRFEATIPMPAKPDYTLKVDVTPAAPAKPVSQTLVDPKLGDPRLLACEIQSGTTLACNLNWGETALMPLPFLVSDALLSYDALKKGKNTLQMDDGAEAALLDNLMFLNGDGSWRDTLLFNKSDGKTPQALPDFSPPDDKKKSFVVPGSSTDKALPARGHIRFGS
jgi:hypothetical protein